MVGDKSLIFFLSELSTNSFFFKGVVFLFVCLFMCAFQGLTCGIWKFPGGQLELELLAYTTATAMPDQNCVCDLHHSSRQHWILNPLNEARDRTCNLMVPSQILLCYHENSQNRQMFGDGM